MLCCRCSPSDFHSGAATSSNSSLRFRQISFVDFKSDKSLHIAALRCHGRIADTEKRIQHGPDTRRSVQFDAPFGELNREGRRMRTFFFTALNCFIGHEPRVAAATQVVSSSMTPARDVALVLIRHPKRQPIQFYSSGLREMKYVFMAIVKKSRRIDRLEMAE